MADLQALLGQNISHYRIVEKLGGGGAFPEPEWQLERYMATMNHAGFTELRFRELANGPDGRIWRTVPHGKWYASQHGTIPSCSEVVLFHTL